MKKLTSLLALALTATFATAQAQIFKTPEGNLKLIGCGPSTQGGGVQCDFQLANPDGFNDDVNANDYKYATADGTVHDASRIKLHNENWDTGYTTSVKVLAGLPVNISVIFEDLDPKRPIPYLIVHDTTVSNVPMRGASAPANVNVSGNKVSVQSSGFTVDLTGCTAKNGGYTCTGATLTPKQ